MEKLVAQEKYKDWIFLFGTIIVAEGPLPEDYNDGGSVQVGNYTLYNFAPVYKGYDPKVTDHRGKRFLVPKRFMSQCKIVRLVSELAISDNTVLTTSFISS